MQIGWTSVPQFHHTLQLRMLCAFSLQHCSSEKGFTRSSLRPAISRSATPTSNLYAYINGGTQWILTLSVVKQVLMSTRLAASGALAEQQLQFQAEKQKEARANVMDRVSSRPSLRSASVGTPA